MIVVIAEAAESERMDVRSSRKQKVRKNVAHLAGCSMKKLVLCFNLKKVEAIMANNVD